MLREANEGDIDAIRRWRNHPKVRSTAIYREPITESGHAAWWARVSADPTRRVLIFEYAGSPCGAITINDHDPVAGTAEWGFFLDVDGLTERGTLLPAWLELQRAAINYGFADLGLNAMGGRTVAWNKPVVDLHLRTGFALVPERGYTATIDGGEEDVVWTEMTRETWQKRYARKAKGATSAS